MISVENFYWILYEKLLRPANIDANFFYPFGSRDPNNVVSQSFTRSAKNQHLDFAFATGKEHSVFFYDQEPMYDTPDTELAVALGLGRKWHKPMRLLANSEISCEKNKILREHRALDWYFFFHGFAALDWFRDARFLESNYNITHPFLSLNHLVTGNRAYRILLTAKLIQKNLPVHGAVSLHATVEQCISEIQNNPLLSSIDQNWASKNLAMIGNGMIVDCDQISGQSSATFGHWEYKMLQRAFLHVVNETVFYDPKLHLTEKIFKPIISRRPFVLVAAPGNLAYFKSYGFKTFDQWIDESYDQEVDDNRRLDLIAREIEKICCLDHQQRHCMYQDMCDVLEFNHKHFFGEFRKLIVNELVDNFERCIKIWNNGRIDDYGVIHRVDFDSVKKSLLC